MLKIGILSSPHNGSPKILANALSSSIGELGHYSRVYYNIKALRRLFRASEVEKKPLLWLLFKILYFLIDWFLFLRLRKMDAVVICDWTPHGFYKDAYHVKRLKQRIGNKPVLYYAVQYLMNSPTIVNRLNEGGHDLLGRYDWHLTVSLITEKRGIPSPPWSQIGLNLKSSGIKPSKKESFFVIVDFLRKGYEDFRNIQIKVLNELNIEFVSLERQYSLSEIREIYSRAALMFIQFPEAYGLPIAECLAFGAYIGTPESSWPMSWRLDENPEIHGPGKLPECFFVYNGENDLRNKLIELKNSYILDQTPFNVFDVFIKNYPTYYSGNHEALQEVLERIENDNLFDGN